MDERYRGAVSALTGAVIGGAFGANVFQPVGVVGIAIAALVGAVIGYVIMYALPRW